MIRQADPQRDAAACAAIYAPFVHGSAVSFEDEPPDASEMAARIERGQAAYPWLVAEIGDQVVGFAYASQHRSRSAYRWAADVSVYVDPARQRGGIGRALYQALLSLLRRQRLHVACAGITLPNDASVGLHEALGFVPIGVYRRIGFKAGAWRDVGWWQLSLTDSEGNVSPAEPLGPQAL